MSDQRLLRLSEIFESIQGEGASAGLPCVFVRLATCNLRCTWCDTPYTWDWDAHDYATEVTKVDVDTVLSRVVAHPSRRLVVTGGEPLLQQRALVPFLERLPRNIAVEVETNGTLVPDAPLLSRIDQWNVSPKLANSGETRERAIQLDALRVLRDTGRAWLKLVIASEADAVEAESLIDELAWPRDRVLFMPLASQREQLLSLMPTVRAAAERRGLRVSPRLHVEQWDGARGV